MALEGEERSPPPLGPECGSSVTPLPPLGLYACDMCSDQVIKAWSGGLHPLGFISFYFIIKNETCGTQINWFCTRLPLAPASEKFNEGKKQREIYTYSYLAYLGRLKAKFHFKGLLG